MMKLILAVAIAFVATTSQAVPTVDTNKQFKQFVQGTDAIVDETEFIMTGNNKNKNKAGGNKDKVAAKKEKAADTPPPTPAPPPNCTVVAEEAKCPSEETKCLEAIAHCQDMLYCAATGATCEKNVCPAATTEGATCNKWGVGSDSKHDAAKCKEALFNDAALGDCCSCANTELCQGQDNWKTTCKEAMGGKTQDEKNDEKKSKGKSKKEGGKDKTKDKKDKKKGKAKDKKESEEGDDVLSL